MEKSTPALVGAANRPWSSASFHKANCPQNSGGANTKTK
jgi:hypothetical protein